MPLDNKHFLLVTISVKLKLLFINYSQDSFILFSSFILGPRKHKALCICLHRRYLAHPWARVRALAVTWCPEAALVWVQAWAPSSWASSRMETPSLKAMGSPSCTDGPVPPTTRPRPTEEGTVTCTSADALFTSNYWNNPPQTLYILLLWCHFYFSLWCSHKRDWLC